MIDVADSAQCEQLAQLEIANGLCPHVCRFPKDLRPGAM